MKQIIETDHNGYYEVQILRTPSTLHLEREKKIDYWDLQHTCYKIYNRALVEGELVRPKTCSRCKRQHPVGHHPDYRKPKQVIWLCYKCHAAEHTRLYKEKRLGQKK